VRHRYTRVKRVDSWFRQPDIPDRKEAIMARIAAIVCGAGVSSTFLARALHALVVERGLDWSIEPLAEDELIRRSGDVAMVFVGHHLAYRFADVQARLALSGVPFALLETSDQATAAEQGVAALDAMDQARQFKAITPPNKGPSRA
jgi:PTS system cellobiose-specific IIB component